MAHVAITGATGFAGGAAASALRAAGHDVIAVTRGVFPSQAGMPGIAVRVVPDLADERALAAALHDVDTVFHFADRADRRDYTADTVGCAAHVMAALRRAALSVGIGRVAVASSVHAGYPDRAGDLYGRSKRDMEAEAIGDGAGPRAIVLRLPPLYGPGMRGAVRHIARAAAAGLPLPFAAARASRRFLSIDQLGALSVSMAGLDDATWAAAAGTILTPSAADAQTLARLARILGGGRTRLFPVPAIDRLLPGAVDAATIAAERDAVARSLGYRPD